MDSFTVHAGDRLGKVRSETLGATNLPEEIGGLEHGRRWDMALEGGPEGEEGRGGYVAHGTSTSHKSQVDERTEYSLCTQAALDALRLYCLLSVVDV